ncbi:SulP family inorganic anion transporter [Salipaludibacillus neizhouensis]|uniref:SulP family inorganic anion transporter n=2 Tax=Salipaludibacillus neizhouensis TaxID=885475 RepID=UPI002695B801
MPSFCWLDDSSLLATHIKGNSLSLRLSSLVAGFVLMFLIIALGNIVVQIPMAALAGVMIMVAIGTFDWSSLKNIHKLPRTDAAVMVVTVGTVLYTHDLSKGVFAGVVLSTIFFAIKISKVKVDSTLEGDSVKVYQLKGLLFFASVTDFHRLI